MQRGVIGGRSKEIQLRPILEEPVHRDRHRPHRDAPGHRETECRAGPRPQLLVQRRRGENDAAGRGGAIGILHLHHHPSGSEPAPPEPPALRFGEPSQQRVQDAEIVGVGGEGMGHAILRSHFRR